MLPSPMSEAQIRSQLLERERPRGTPVMYQSWQDLLFLHWSFPVQGIQRDLPEGLTVDSYDGKAWVGIVPFFMCEVRPRWLPAVPGISNFQELNLRTYVRDAQGRPGVWFYSLDAAHRLPVWVARRFFHLNYVYARMAAVRSESVVHYTACRSGAVEQVYDWSRVGPAAPAEPGSLAFFLAERYRLFAYDASAKQLHTGRVHHAPYPLQSASVRDWSEDLFALNGLSLPDRSPDSVLAAERVDVSIYPME